MRNFLISGALLVGVLCLPLQPQLSAAEEVDVTHNEVLRATLPDFQQTRQRLEQGIWGTVWRMDALAPMREQWADMLAELKTDHGVDMVDIYQHFTGAHLRWHGFSVDDFTPQLALVADFGPAMDQLWQVIAAELQPAEAQHGADAVLSSVDEGFLFLRHGQQLSILGDGFKPLQLPDDKRSYDIEGVYSLTNLFQLLADMDIDVELSEADRKMMQALVEHMGDITFTAEVQEDGILERFHAPMSDELLTAWASKNVDTQQIDRFPQDSLMLLAGYLNISAAEGSEFYTPPQQLKNDLTGMASISPQFAQLADPLVDIYYAIDGTVLIGVLPSMPYPALALQLPVNEHSELALNQLLAAIQSALPAPGEQQRLEMVPMLPITMARDEGQLLITSHPRFAQQWLQGEGGGAMTSAAAVAALAAHNDETMLNGFGLSDTPRVLQTLQGAVGIAGLMGMDAEHITMINAAVAQLQQDAGYGFLITESGNGESLTTIKSVTGTYTSLPIIMAAVGAMWVQSEHIVDVGPLVVEAEIDQGDKAKQLGLQATDQAPVQWEAMPPPSRSEPEIMAAWKQAAAELSQKEEAPASPEEDNDDEVDEHPEPATLRWFRRHQSADGSWSAAGHPAVCTLDGPKVAPDTAIGAWGVGWPERDVLLTAASTLVYLGAGYDHRTPNRYQRVVLRGLEYLAERVGEQAPPLVHHHTRAMVALTLAEAYAMTNDPELRGPAERALATMLATALTTVDGEATKIVGWAATNDGTVVDLQATLVGAMALMSAQAGGLDVGTHRDDLRLWFMGLLDDSEAILQQAGRSDICLPQRASVSRDRLYGEDSAVGLALAAFLGVSKKDDSRIAGLAVRVLDQFDPIADQDPFQRYVASLGIFQVGGPWWQAFHPVQRNDLVRQQIDSDNCRDGSWPAHPGLQETIGSSAITSTIYNSLAQQIYYRYMPAE